MLFRRKQAHAKLAMVAADECFGYKDKRGFCLSSFNF